MTENEVKSKLEVLKEWVGDVLLTRKDMQNAIDEAIKALEKQIPKKPNRKPNADMTHEEVTCPICGRYVDSYRNQYCDCGQKLDWEEQGE